MSFIDLTEKKYGYVTPLKYLGGRRWLCRCDCGREFNAFNTNLRRGKTKSCGCYRRKVTIERHLTHGQTKTRLYGIWTSMKTRCYNSHDENFKKYGLKGIDICPEWRTDFSSFYAWSKENGYSDDLTIDRIDGKKGYSPDNCRWVDCYVQARNKSNNRYINFNGENKTLAEWSQEYGLHHTTILYRLRAGWSIEDALTTPAKHRTHEED